MVRGRKEGSKKEERSIGWVRVKYLEISQGLQGKDGMVKGEIPQRGPER